MSYNRKIASLGFISSSTRLAFGPLTLLFITQYLTNEEVGIYYIFFSITSLQQLLEVGMSNVLKQYISHSRSNQEITDYFKFSLVWYFILSSFFVVLASIVAWANLSQFSGQYEWEFAFGALLVGSAINLTLSGIRSFLDGTQQQLILQKLTLISQIAGSLSLWLALYFDNGLYSTAISQWVTVVFFIAGVIYIPNIFSCVIKDRKIGFFKVFKELYPLLKNTSIVWFLGYFYWNSFNFISLHSLGLAETGALGITLALFRMGFNVASSITISQMTIYAKNISNGMESVAKQTFFRYSVISFLVLFAGYTLFVIFYVNFKTLSFFNNLLSVTNMLWLGGFFILSLVITMLNNFVRCYKVEPFVKLSLFASILVPIAFYTSIRLGLPYFSVPSLVNATVLFFSVFYYIKYAVLLENNHENSI